MTGKSDEEHLSNLDQVLSRLKKEKCRFLLPEVEFLGHILTAKGIRPSPKNVKAIQKVDYPKDTTQLKSFLGMVTYYLKFLPNLSNTLFPLYSLLQKGSTWKWEKEHELAFTQVKNQLISPVTLATFNPDRELVLQCNASPYGVGAVLSHRDSDGSEHPIAYSSRTLAPAKKRYSQIDKEALALVFGVKKFHIYLYGRRFTLVSDHKPLLHIMGENRGVPQMASARLQRWSLLLGAYNNKNFSLKVTYDFQNGS